MKALQLSLMALMLALPLYAQQDSNVSLMIRFANGSNHFYIGEVIPIELSFSASLSNTYDMGTQNYDRSGRLNIEKFHVTPPGRDPLQNYYYMTGIIGGGLSSGPRVLSGEPQIMREDLNEWVALDKPGHYSLYVTSSRIGRRSTIQDERVELRSNSLEFDVVAADSVWQQQTLSSAVETLNIESSTAEEKTAAARILRFLDTPGSLQELIRRLGTSSVGGHWNEIAGLAGSRDQNLVVHALEQRMNSPDMGVTNEYLFILSKLKFQLEHEPLPLYPEKDIQQQKIWRELLQTRDKEHDELEDNLYEKAAALVQSKSGAARAETVRMLLLHPSHERGAFHPVEGLPPEDIVSAFLNSSEDQQYDLLSTWWERLNVPAMAGPLKNLAEQPNLKHQWLRDLALRHLYELDPAEATPIFLEEIRHPHLDDGVFMVRGATLGLLPNEILPQFDEILSARLAQKKSRTKEIDAQLVARFSTKAVLTEVKNTYEASAGKWDCVEEDALVLYFLRMDPDYGVKRLAVAPSVCMPNSLSAVMKMHRWSEVEPGIIARLNGPDLNRGGQAAETLAKYGSPQAEKAMWERLRSFHAVWAERENELVYGLGRTREANEAASFQSAIVDAIGKAQAWLLTNEEVTDLENLNLGKERDVKRWHWNSPVDLVVNAYSHQVNVTFNHNQYSAQDLESLRGKLAQYPKGTEFSLIIEGTPALAAPALDAINEIAAEHGLQVNSSKPIQ